MDFFLGIGSALVLVAILSTRLAQRFGMPALILFVLVGVLAGSSGPGGIALTIMRSPTRSACWRSPSFFLAAA